MATTTPNYGWTVPTSTDLVKDGATAIETLGDAIDASMNTALGTKKAGMVLLSTTSFTGSSSVIRNDFSATYSHYRVLFDIVMSGSNSPTLRFTDSSGASVSSAGYYAYTSNYASTSISNWSNSDVSFGAGGEIIVADFSNHRICELSPDGDTVIKTWAAWGTTAGQFQYPKALAVTGSFLFVMDATRVQVFE
jgi:hypothetical protein